MYKCPVCKKILSKDEFVKATGMLSDLKKDHEHRVLELNRKLKASKAAEAKAKRDGKKLGQAEAQRQLQGQAKVIQKLKEKLKSIEKGKTPQGEGYEFEDKLVAGLKKFFGKDDEIIHKGKGGDVLHIAKFNGKKAGVIIYECKRSPKIKPEYIKQTLSAKQVREADFAVLVTTGTMKKFNGLALVDGVLIVNSSGVIPLVTLLRTNLIEMLKADLTKEEKSKVSQKVLGYITSPQFKNPIEEVVRASSELQKMVLDEFEDHKRIWKKRWDYYQTISWDTNSVKENLNLILQGGEPKALTAKMTRPLILPVGIEKGKTGASNE
jgi:hypothetical protein